ncbi:MAG: phosphatidylglycerol lysyltransferase domain-containing protein [Clostridia bacterium]|nr:phosphatidylglycerol lysyltransferase domain-containing protein [Clostridia bacterium]
MFTRLTTEDAQTLLPFYKRHHPTICDNTIGAVYQWRDAYVSYYAILDCFLLIRAQYGKDGDCYTFPIGCDHGDNDKALDYCERDAALRGDRLRFCVLPSEGLPPLINRYGDRLKIENRREWADYLYSAESFKTFSGKKYHTQKNHVNRFYRDNPQIICVPVSNELEGRCLDFLNEYGREHTDMNAIERNELKWAADLLLMRDKLCQSAFCLVDGKKIVALSIGELRFDTLYVHVEKALSAYSGAYPAMAQAFVRAHPDALFVNREDDAGDEGLRYSKLNYRPIKLIEKYFVEVLPQ